MNILMVIKLGLFLEIHLTIPTGVWFFTSVDSFMPFESALMPDFTVAIPALIRFFSSMNQIMPFQISHTLVLGK